MSTKPDFSPWTIDLCRAYIGAKGYTIPKADIPPDALAHLKTVLMAKPHTPGAPPTASPTLFPIYRESPKKIYIPRYFGEQHFGRVPSMLSPGDSIDVPFVKTLRTYQQPVIQGYIDHVHSYSDDGSGGGGLLELYTAWGKTAGAMYAISAIGGKTIVIVHKEFLLNQWVERIHEFLPSARIGRIQGPIIDTENKDIVMCMLQSLSMKTYPDGLFQQFRLMVVDEVHHISSETFSNALFRVVTPYTLGLSATMNRKDGTSHVFKMFLGDVLHTAVRTAKDGLNVVVYSILFTHSDEAYNATPEDFRGKPQMSTMIATMCGFSPRTEFVLRVLTDFISVRTVDAGNGTSASASAIAHTFASAPKTICTLCTRPHYLVRLKCCHAQFCLPCIENINLNPRSYGVRPGTQTPKPPVAMCPHCKKTRKCIAYEQQYIESTPALTQPYTSRQTLVLAHNLNILKYMYTAIVCRNIASVGYYIGGMSEADLKLSEKKQVILATFQMAAEGLDIPSLNALFLITPKTDIVQSVGRILRSAHASPVIVDINDAHDIFRNQSRKRNAYYKKQGYTILRGTSTRYKEPYFCPNAPVRADSVGHESKSDSECSEDDNGDGDDDDDDGEPLSESEQIAVNKKAVASSTLLARMGQNKGK